MGQVQSRATITHPDVGDGGDSFFDIDVPDATDGLVSPILAKTVRTGGSSAFKKQILLLFQFPEAPADCDVARSNEGILTLTLKLNLSATNRTGSADYAFDETLRDFEEKEVSYSNAPGAGARLADVVITNVTEMKSIVITTLITTLGFRWGDRVSIVGRFAPQVDGTFEDEWSSKEHATVSLRPVLVITYEQKPGDAIEDLKIAAASDDPSLTDSAYNRLTWTPYEGDGFIAYRVFRKVGAGAWAQIGSDITQQGAAEYVDQSGLTENTVIQYDVRLDTTKAGATGTTVISSNIVWMIRADVSTFTVSDTTPDAGQKITATVAPVAYVATPSPVTNKEFYVAWGTSSETDKSGSRWKSDDASPTRDHIWPYATTQTPKCRIRNSLGFWSDLTGLTAGGPTLTVANPGPIAKLLASPMEVLANENITFTLVESYTRAGNKAMHASEGYQFDFNNNGVYTDPAAPPYPADSVQATPTKVVSFTSAGSYTVRARVKDVDALVSAEVTIIVTVSTEVTVNLDSALTDGWAAIGWDFGNNVIVEEGPQANALIVAGQKPVSVKLKGIAWRTLVNDMPADITTLQDVRDNNKQVQTAKITGTAEKGLLRNISAALKPQSVSVWEWTADLVFNT